MSESKCQIQASPTIQKQEIKSSTTSIRLNSILSSCRICLSTIFDPASLTCGHKFCESCLDHYWHVTNKPNYLVCPLCRAHIYNVDFIEKEQNMKQSIGEFRKTFSLLDTVETSDLSKSTLLCFKITMLIPILFFTLKWLKLPLLQFSSLKDASFGIKDRLM